MMAIAHLQISDIRSMLTEQAPCHAGPVVLDDSESWEWGAAAPRRGAHASPDVSEASANPQFRAPWIGTAVAHSFIIIVRARRPEVDGLSLFGG
jgi:hypothetical protein